MTAARPKGSAQQTPRQARLSLNKMEAWFRAHAERYAPEDRVTLRALFEEAHTPEHAAALAEALRAWRPEAGRRDVSADTPADA